MSRFPFELAGPDDDADLRHVLAATPMEGSISVSFRREPSWFGAAVVDGFSRQVVACRDQETGHIFGFGCRSLRELYVNGESATIGYLSSLRVLPAYRNLGLIARGYAFFRRLHQDGRTPLYLTTIAEGNETALRILTSGRAGLPTYHFAGYYHTIVIALPQGRSFGRWSDSEANIRAASNVDLPLILDFLQRYGPRRQFFPVYRAEDFLGAAGLLRGLDLSQVLLAERHGKLVGMLAAWDQRSYRHQVIHAYHGALRWLRPLYNLTAWLRGKPALPAPGEPLPMLMAALPVVAEDDPAIFHDLLTQLHYQCSRGPCTHLLLGLHESDPLLPTARRFQRALYTSLVFLVHWQDGEAFRLALQDRPLYLELGSL